MEAVKHMRAVTAVIKSVIDGRRTADQAVADLDKLWASSHELERVSDWLHGAVMDLQSLLDRFRNRRRHGR